MVEEMQTPEAMKAADEAFRRQPRVYIGKPSSNSGT
jgi:hypothetical protein